MRVEAAGTFSRSFACVWSGTCVPTVCTPGLPAWGAARGLRGGATTRGARTEQGLQTTKTSRGEMGAGAAGGKSRDQRFRPSVTDLPLVIIIT